MNWKKFFAGNSFIIGTAIIIIGFVWMITQAIVIVPFSQTLISFFFTISGIIFWGVGVALNKRSDRTDEAADEVKESAPLTQSS